MSKIKMVLQFEAGTTETLASIAARIEGRLMESYPWMVRAQITRAARTETYEFPAITEETEGDEFKC